MSNEPTVPTFTPGPWHWTGGILAPHPTRGFWILTASEFSPNEEANKALIAAAPDLYQALAVLVLANETLDYPLPRATLARAKAALAKARGESY